MFRARQANSRAFKRIARRVEEILAAAGERERHGQRLALEIDARFQLQDVGAVQFQLASAILEELSGLDEEEIVCELLSLGLAAVLDGTAQAARETPLSDADPSAPADDSGVDFQSLFDPPALTAAPHPRTVH